MTVKRKSILSGSVEDRFAMVEVHIKQLNRRRGNYVIGVTPPIPVFDYTEKPDETGIVFRKLMPASGIVTVGCMYVEELTKKSNPQAVLDVDGPIGGARVKIDIGRQALSIQPKMPVEAGQRLTLSIDPPDACSGIWTAFLFEIDDQHIRKQSQLVEGFLKLVEEADEELSDA